MDKLTLSLGCLIFLKLTNGLAEPVQELIKPYYDIADSRKLFKEFIITYNKSYSINEYELRHERFLVNLNTINDLNAQIERGIYAINKFTDLSFEEFNDMYTGYKPNGEIAPVFPEDYINSVHDMPESFDWRSKGVVTDVKDQGKCNSSWAFASIANIEALNALKTGNLIAFSEQHLVDCDTADSGCKGGEVYNAMNYLLINKIGVMPENDYPYTGKVNDCRYDDDKSVKINLRKGMQFSKFEEYFIQVILYLHGPLTAAINPITMINYKGGIDHPNAEQCNHNNISHVVTIVGYGVENGMKYWIIKNSWGKDWGEDGYYRLVRDTMACGINQRIYVNKI